MTAMEQTSHTVRAVIFDVDGTMFDTEPVYCLSWQEAARELGYEISDALYLECVGHSISDSHALLQERFGEEFPVERFRALWNEIWTERVRRHPPDVKAGLYELLAYLEERGVPKAIATSNDRERALLVLCDLAERFHFMVSGEQLTHGKPSPEIFHLAAKGLGSPPGLCLVLEDSEAGVLAADAAGMGVILVPDLKLPSREIVGKASLVCKSLHDVREVLERGAPFNLVPGTST